MNSSAMSKLAGSTVRIRRWGIELATVAFAIRVLIKSKLEIRNSKQFLIGKNKKTPNQPVSNFVFRITSDLDFSISFGFRYSDFGFLSCGAPDLRRRSLRGSPAPCWLLPAPP